MKTVAIKAISAWLVQMLDVAFSRRMCCSRVASVRQNARLPCVSVVSPTSRPGIWRANFSRVAMMPASEWKGVPLSHILDVVGTLPQARYVVYRSMQPGWWESIDMADALHPQTFVAHGMNGGELPVAFGGPLRLRVPRQLGYKSVKYITRLTVSDSLKGFGKGLGSASPEAGYAWYAGI